MAWPTPYVLHILINGRRITSSPNGGHFEVISTNASLTRRSKHHRHLLQQFTNQWQKHYLLSLRENHIVKSKVRNGPEIAVGDIVILKQESSNRMFWKLAKVEELLPGRDGTVRSAIVKVANTDKNPCFMRRSVKHLFPIEVNAKLDEDEVNREVTNTLHAPQVNCADQNTRPHRNAAIVADILRRFNQWYRGTVFVYCMHVYQFVYFSYVCSPDLKQTRGVWRKVGTSISLVLSIVYVTVRINHGMLVQDIWLTFNLKSISVASL